MVFWLRQNSLSFERECQLLKLLGFGIELWPNTGGLNECRYDKRNWARLAAATENMLVAMRSRNDEPTLQQWDEQIQCAKLLDANIVTDLQSLGIVDGTNNNGRGFTEEVVKLADTNKIQLCLETGPLPILKQIGKKFDSIRYCLDVGYATVNSESGFKQYVDELAPRIVHLHLSDNYGQIDDHQTPGLQGGISRENWDQLLNTLNKYDNDIVAALEMRPSMPAMMIRQASEFLFDKMNWPGKPQKQPDYTAVSHNPG